MHFLSSRSTEPSRRNSDLDIAEGRCTPASIPIQEKISTHSVLKRVTTLFNPRKRTLSKSADPLRHGTGGNAPVGFIRDSATVYPRSSSSSSSGSPDEIRRPSGLGRRASLMESLQLPIGSVELESNRYGGEPCRSRSLLDPLNHPLLSLHAMQVLSQDARHIQAVYKFPWRC